MITVKQLAEWLIAQTDMHDRPIHCIQLSGSCNSKPEDLRWNAIWEPVHREVPMAPGPRPGLVPPHAKIDGLLWVWEEPGAVCVDDG